MHTLSVDVSCFMQSHSREDVAKLRGSLELLSGMPQPSKPCCGMIRFLWVVALVKFLRSGVL